MLSAEIQVSEQEMDEVIARSTYQDSREASASPGLGTVPARFHSVFGRVSFGAHGALPCSTAGFSLCDYQVGQKLLS